MPSAARLQLFLARRQAARRPGLPGADGAQLTAAALPILPFLSEASFTGMWGTLSFTKPSVQCDKWELDSSASATLVCGAWRDGKMVTERLEPAPLGPLR